MNFIMVDAMPAEAADKEKTGLFPIPCSQGGADRAPGKFRRLMDQVEGDFCKKV